jgi:asparagine synthase (glutamine-hydrolysing)
MRVAALPEYLTFSFVPGAGTMFEDIYELQPGSILTYAEGRPTVRRHFFFEDREFLPGGEPDENRHVHEVRAALEASVHAACSAMEEPPAVYLSGGIDSSAVLAVAANQHTGRRLKTFSVHFGSRYTNENAYVAMMVDRCHTDHTWLEIRPRGFVNEMRRIIWSLDDPIGDPITVPNYLLSQVASEAAQWVLNGEGGDPCFGGPKNIPMMLSGLYGPGSADAGDTWLEREYLRSFRKCYGDLTDLLDPGVLRESGGVEALAAHIIPFLRADKPKSFLNKLMAMNIRLKGANLIQIKVDKMSSANGLLALAPLFSRRTIEAAMACPPWLKLEGNVEKAVLKKAVRDIVPDAIIQRPKCGMMVPVKFWFQGEMRRYAHKVLSKKNLRRIGLFNAEYVRRLLKYDLTDLRGQRYGTKLWMLITFMLWYEQMIESVPQPPRQPAGAAAPSVSFLGRWRQGKQSTAGMASSHTHEETVA